MYGYRYRSVLWNSYWREFLFFFSRNIPFPTSVLFLTLYDTLLTARGHRVFFVFARDVSESCLYPEFAPVDDPT